MIAPLPVDVTIEGIPVCIAGVAIDYDPRALDAAVKGDEVEYEVGLPGEGEPSPGTGYQSPLAPPFLGEPPPASGYPARLRVEG